MTLTLSARTTAIVMIDLQQGIAGRQLAPYTGEQVIEKSVALANRLMETGGTVVRVHVAFSPGGADRLSQPVDEAMPSPPGGMPANFSEFVPAIAALPAHVTITKRQWGAFYGTELDLQLRRRGISTIIMTGVATNFGVEATALEAWQHGYAVVVAEDACSTMSEEMHKFAITRIMPRISRVRSTAEILAALSVS